MKTLFVLISIFFILANATNADQRVKEEHAKILKFYGEQLENSVHFYSIYSYPSFSGSLIEQPFSIFTSGKKASYYYENNGKKIQVVSEYKSEQWIITNRFISAEKVLTCKYIINYKFQKDVGIDIQLDNSESDFSIDQQKLLACIVAQYQTVAEVTQACSGQGNLTKYLLQLAVPLYKIYQCIFGVDLVFTDSNQRVVTRNYYISCKGTYHYPMPFPKCSQSYTLENLPVAFIEKHVTASSSGGFARMEATVSGNQLSVTISPYSVDNNWFWNVAGYVKVIYGSN